VDGILSHLPWAIPGIAKTPGRIRGSEARARPTREGPEDLGTLCGGRATVIKV
jgi:hypothetical protein